MKAIIKTAFVCALFAIFSACNGNSHNEHNHEEHSHSHNHGHNHTHEHEHHSEQKHDSEHDTHEHNHSNDITFSQEKASQFGVKIQKITRGAFYETIKVSGQIIGAQGDECTVVAQSAGIIRLRSSIAVGSGVNAGTCIATISAKDIVGGDSNEQARIILNNAKRELDRLKPLYEDKIVTAREYNAALEAYERARAACTSKSINSGAATSAISGTIIELLVSDGQFVEAGAPIAKVSKNAKLVLRADVPASYTRQIENIKTANFRTSTNDIIYSIGDLKGRRISSNVLSASQPGYIPVCFEFINNGEIVSGAFAEIYLIGNERHNIISIPQKSLTEEMGTFYVYVKTCKESYSKRAVKIGINDGINVEIVSGLHEGEMVVTDGAMIIKLAGAGGAVPGHSHEH